MSESENSGVEVATNGEEPRDWLEIIATVFLGIAAVLIAWSTYQSQLWGGIQDTLNTNSVLEIVDAADDLGRADSTRSLDQLLFGEVILRPDPDEAVLLFNQLSEQGQTATEVWGVNKEVRPFDGDAYILGVYGEGLAKREAAFALFDSAAEANQNGDDYVLVATIIALVLFLAGVSLVLKGRLTRTILVAGSGVILAVVTIIVAGLPLASGAKTEETIKTDATAAANAEFAAVREQAELADQELLSNAAAAASAPEEAEAPAPDEVDESAPADDPVGETWFPTQGGTAFAVYIEVIEASESSGDDFADTIAALEELDVVWAVASGLDCDEGSVEGLGLEAGDYLAAAAYFETLEDAAAFAAANAIPADDIVEIRTFCVD